MSRKRTTAVGSPVPEGRALSLVSHSPSGLAAAMPRAAAPGKRETSEFGRLITLEIPALRRYSRRLTRDPVEAEDLLQSCLLRALAKEELWRPGTNLRRWLFTMLYHQRISGLRRQARERHTLGAAVGALASPVVSDPSGRLLVAEIMRAIAALPQGQREAVYRIVLDGMGYDETAKALAVPVGTVRSRLARARIALRKLVVEDAGSGAVLPLPGREAAGGGVRHLAA